MQALLQLPMALQLTIIFLVGTVLGSQLNHCASRFAWFGTPTGPWFPPPEGASPRIWKDYVPVVGWFELKRDTAYYWPRFWLRPMMVEVLFGMGIAALYWWEVLNSGMLPGGLLAVDEDVSVRMTRFGLHVILIWGMAVATLIDMDEKTIPDEITVPGTLFALLVAALLPWAMMPEVGITIDGSFASTPVTMVSPSTEPPWLVAQDLPIWSTSLDTDYGLAMGMFFFAAWVFAVAPKTIWTRSGTRKMLQYMVASFMRHPMRWFYVIVLIGGEGAIAMAWICGGDAWQGLLTALTGMAFGGGLVWGVRIVGTFVLQREAMGFGDVTLMAMIGAFLGWQAALLVFFFAPFAGAVIAIVQWLVTRCNNIAFGPFLCAATLFVLLRWAVLWQQAYEIFSLGWIIPIVVLFCLALMGIMLALWQWIKMTFIYGQAGSSIKK